MLISGKVSDDNVVPAENIDLKDKMNAINTNRQEHSQDILQASSVRAKNVNPVMIICCPNAGYYECMHYEVELRLSSTLH